MNRCVLSDMQFKKRRIPTPCWLYGVYDTKLKRADSPADVRTAQAQTSCHLSALLARRPGMFFPPLASLFARSFSVAGSLLSTLVISETSFTFIEHSLALKEAVYNFLFMADYLQRLVLCMEEK